MICILDCDAEEALAFRRAAASVHESVEVCSDAITPNQLQNLPYGCAVSVSHRGRIDAAALERMARRGVRYLNTRSVGVNHIDTDRARLLGIQVEGVGYDPESVAEHAVLLMLMAVRQIKPVLDRAARGDYRLPENRAGTLCGMTVGVVGAGRIGRRVMDLLGGFGCNLLCHDPAPRGDVAISSLADLLARSDLVTLHAPLTRETWHMLDRDAIARMKPGAILVNAARGALVDGEALAEALASGHLAGAGLDVVEGEEGWFYRDRWDRADAPFRRLAQMPNVVITPHLAYYTRQALQDIVEMTLRNCAAREEEQGKWIV